MDYSAITFISSMVNKTFSKEDLLQLLLAQSIIPSPSVACLHGPYLIQALESGIIHHWDTFMSCLVVMCSRRLGAQYLMILPI